jgi:O-antigen ligase
MAVALPWLWPWAPPPSPSVPGLLAAWSFTALVWLVLAFAQPRQAPGLAWRFLLTVAGLIGLAALHMPVIDLSLLGGLAGSLLCVGVAAQAARQPLPPLPRLICWGLLAAAVTSAVIAGLQYSGLLRTPGLGWTWLHASPNEEAYGQLRQRNQFGSLMSLGLAAWFYLAHSDRTTRARRGLAWLLLLVLTLGAAASSSRTGALTWIGLAVMMLLWPLHPGSRPTGLSIRQGALAALVAFVALSTLLPYLATSLNSVALPKVGVFERLASQPEGLGHCESRAVLWRHVLELSWQRPWLGWGWGELDFAHASQPVMGERFCAQLGNAHNLFLQVAVEWGWPLALLGLGVVIVWIGRHRPWQARSPAQLLGWSWLGVIGLHSLLEFPLWYGPFQMVLGLGIGLVAAGREPPLAVSAPASRPSQSMSGGVALWLAITLWAGWDYHRVSQVFQPAHLRSPDCTAQPHTCLDAVVWFHQGRDFARLRQQREAQDCGQVGALAQRVAHYAPEPWVLALLPHPPAPPSPTPFPSSRP